MDFTGNSSEPPPYQDDVPMPSASKDENEKRPIYSTSAEENPEGVPPPYKPPTFITDGTNITFEDGDLLNPQYRLTRNVFELRPGPSISIERLIYAGDPSPEASNGSSSTGATAPTHRTVKQLYHITTTDVSRWHHFQELLQGQEGSSAARPWRVSALNADQSVLEAKHGLGVKHAELMSGPDPHRVIRWCDARGVIVAVEYRAVVAKSREMETLPRLEILGDVGDEMVGFLLAVWVARLRQEGIYSHRGHLSVQLSKLLLLFGNVSERG